MSFSCTFMLSSASISLPRYTWPEVISRVMTWFCVYRKGKLRLVSMCMQAFRVCGEYWCGSLCRSWFNGHSKRGWEVTWASLSSLIGMPIVLVILHPAVKECLVLRADELEMGRQAHVEISTSQLGLIIVRLKPLPSLCFRIRTRHFSIWRSGTRC